jgi:hypothetical protein
VQDGKGKKERNKQIKKKATINKTKKNKQTEHLLHYAE